MSADAALALFVPPHCDRPMAFGGMVGPLPVARHGEETLKTSARYHCVRCQAVLELTLSEPKPSS